MSSESYPARAAFVGRRGDYTLRALVLALTLAFVYSIPLVIVQFGPLPNWYRPSVYLAIVAVSTFTGATVNAYYNSGLFVSCIVAGVGFIPISVAVTSTSVSVGREPTLSFAVGQLLLVAGLYGTLVGTVGFVTGVGLRETVGPKK